MSAPQKLTKKQKKGVAFRERKQGRGKGKDAVDDVDNDVPIQEDQDTADVQAVQVESKGVVRSKGEPKVKKPSKDVDAVVSEKQKKRKREVEPDEGEGSAKKEAKEDTQADKPKRKKKKGSVDGDDAETGVAKAAAPKKPSQNELKQRFILFVGNLKYTTSLDAIKAHFAACDPPPTVRLLTPKASAGRPTSSNKSKGCAFLEFSHRNALQQALKLHQSEIEGRKINVELTAGGGGKSETRITKLKERNKDLDGQRMTRLEKEAGGEHGKPIAVMPERPQRYSATSGMDLVPTERRTWTVGDVDDGETHRGGQKHTKGREERPQRPGRLWGTGVNAIPVTRTRTRK